MCHTPCAGYHKSVHIGDPKRIECHLVSREVKSRAFLLCSEWRGPNTPSHARRESAKRGPSGITHKHFVNSFVLQLLDQALPFRHPRPLTSTRHPTVSGRSTLSKRQSTHIHHERSHQLKRYARNVYSLLCPTRLTAWSTKTASTLQYADFSRV